MGKIIALYVAIGALVLLARIAFGMAGSGRPFGPPRPVAKRFLTSREAAMLDALERALPHCRIHAQVAMGALLAVPALHGRKRHIGDRNAFSQKIVDFVAQDRATGNIVALIEVDDRTHNPIRDARRDAMTAGAGYATIRIPGSVRPTFHEVRDRVAALLAPPGVTLATPMTVGD